MKERKMSNQDQVTSQLQRQIRDQKIHQMETDRVLTAMREESARQLAEAVKKYDKNA
jgi:hypothetical protein